MQFAYSFKRSSSYARKTYKAVGWYPKKNNLIGCEVLNLGKKPKTSSPSELVAKYDSLCILTCRPQDLNYVCSFLHATNATEYL